MDAFDVASWLLAGLISGAMIGAIKPAPSRMGQIAFVVAGTSSALLGGMLAASAFGMSAVAFLGAVCAGVAGAALQCALPWSRTGTRYHG